MPTKVWLDTDIGTDVDDAVALSLALVSPEIELIGVSTVYGDVGLRSRMALRLLALAGAAGVPVHSGCERPLLNDRPVYWAGWEGEGLLTAEDEMLRTREIRSTILRPSPEHAADAIIRAVSRNEGEVVLAAIGPLSNVGLALMKEPALAQKVRLLLTMGGVCRCGANGLDLPFAEHNIKCDPEAASLVFRCGAPIVMVGLDVTTRVRITAEGVQAVRNVGDPLRLALADQLQRYLAAMKRDYTTMHDPLALAYAIKPELLRLAPCDVLVETRSEIAAGATWVRHNAASRTQVAVGVDSERFEEFLLERLTGARS